VQDILKRVLWRPFRPVINQLGFDVVRTGVYAFAQHIGRLDVTLVFDVGANTGQFARQLWSSGYDGKIVSFEPVTAAFKSLSEAAKNDPRWATIHGALGSRMGEAVINVSARTNMSSFRKIGDQFTQQHEWAKICGTETVNMRTLDSVFLDYVSSEDRILLKMDVQGYENEVLAGAARSLPRITAIQIELALTQSYSGQPLLCDLVNSIESHEFRLIDISGGFRDKDNRLVEVDGFFERTAR